MYTPTKNAIDHINKATAENRRTHAIKMIADWEELFILQNAAGEIAYGTVDDYLVLPLWPAKVFADQNSQGNWQSFTSMKYEVHDFFDLIEKEEENGEFVTVEDQEFVFLISVHPVGDKSGFILAVEEYMRDILYELRKYS